MDQYWFVNCDKYTILMSDANNRENRVCGIWELSVLSPQFFCESKTILNKTFTRNVIGGLWALCELVPLPPPPLLPSSIDSAHNNSPPTPSLPVRGALLFIFMTFCV